MKQFRNKKEMRQFCQKRLKAIKPSQKRDRDKKINRVLIDIIKILNPNSMLLYMPLKFEADIEVVLKRFKKKVYLPFMEGKSFKIVKYRLPIKIKKFGIKEPPNSFFKLSHIDLAIVPVIGVDGSFRRIGFGKGMYDRFFGKLSYRPIVIFVEIEKCFTTSKICDSYDVLGDIYITPNEILIRGDENVGRVVSRKLCSNHKRRCRIFYSKKDRKK